MTTISLCTGLEVSWEAGLSILDGNKPDEWDSAGLTVIVNVSPESCLLAAQNQDLISFHASPIPVLMKNMHL